ncbi:mRNA-capping enzyme-like [Dysidea avara]|uniref:mRNA-capping enzyme-like n=1 Tax=Dysidea avara TaxID=196820 RepID=UPI00331CF9B9
MNIPERWLNCPRKGRIVAGKFLPFKTPLSDRYNDQVPEENRFPLAMLLDSFPIGLVVDLTKTDRYYDKQEVIQRGIGYHKLLCEGHGEAPNAEQTKQFVELCKHFFSLPDHRGQIIGVHCTHGYNRTGFLISAYFIEEEDWSLEQAIKSFCTARPPGIYKDHYISDLADRYNAGDREEITTPTKPSWCFDEDGSGEEDEQAGDGSFRKRKKRRREVVKRDAKFVISTPLVTVAQSSIREEVQEACQVICNWERSGFPGAQPVSMDTKNIMFIRQKPFRVSWKADGTRYMMLIRNSEHVYMVDRDNTVFAVRGLKFPSRRNPEESLRDTLVDGEMVLDKDKGVIKPRYLMYDIMQFENSTDVSKCDHPKRLHCIEKEVIQPREEACKKGNLMKESEPFSIRLKGFWDVANTRTVLENLIPTLAHENDGLIFSPALEPYTAGQCNDLLKWKPAELNTVDFKLKIERTGGAGILPETIGNLYVGGYEKPFATIKVKNENRALKEYDGRIIECFWDSRNTTWKFLRVREDKSFPNSHVTATSVCNSIIHPVTREWLLDEVERCRWKPRLPPPTQNTRTNMPPPKLPGR